MTRYDAIRRQLGDIEKHHERALAKHETQMMLKDGYCRKLEDLADINAELLADALHCSKGEAVKRSDDAYEARQAARKASGYVGGMV